MAIRICLTQVDRAEVGWTQAHWRAQGARMLDTMVQDQDRMRSTRSTFSGTSNGLITLSCRRSLYF